MTVFTFHLARTKLLTSVQAMCKAPSGRRIAGLHHAECMAAMTLGAPIVSPARMQLGKLAMFAAWENEAAIDAFLESPKLGLEFAEGWHVRLELHRRWGKLSAFDRFAESDEKLPADAPVVAVTLARMKLPQVPRFVRWGKPVETLVRDHPGVTLAVAAMRLPRTVSTFSVWTSVQEMVEMVQGRSSVSQPKRHSDAMIERERKDFHHEFTTLRFRPLSEHGVWEGRSGIVPGMGSSISNLGR